MDVVRAPASTTPRSPDAPPEAPAPQVKELEYAPAPTPTQAEAPAPAYEAAGDAGDFKFTFVKSGMLGINVKRTRFEISGIRPSSCIELRNRELAPEFQLRLKDKVIAVNG